MNDSQQTMIQGLRCQERSAQEQALIEYGSKVFATISRVVSRQEDAEEVYQDVFIKAFQHIGSFNETKASFQNWLCKIAYNESLNFIRNHKQPVVYIDDSNLLMKDVQEQDLDHLFQQQDEQTIQAVEQALSLLNAKEQSLVYMYYFDDLSLKEIAYVMDMQPSTVGSSLHRIRQKLYRIIIEQRSSNL